MKRVAIVTGGTGGLGAAVARAFADADYEVHVTASQPVAPGKEGPGQVHVVDLAALAAVRKLAEEFGEVHALALCAGGFAAKNLVELGAADLDGMMTSNFDTAANSLAAFAPKLRAGSAAVLVASQAYRGAPGMAAYAASKAAVVSLAKSAALELKPAGVRVNAILPDVIDTPANRRAMPDADFERWAKPEELASVIVWLCSPAARVVSGNALDVGR
jgi:NAD(P)-dependent dehydrogenase (short-subunit alcohol dehydrogenase family)